MNCEFVKREYFKLFTVFRLNIKYYLCFSEVCFHIAI